MGRTLCLLLPVKLFGSLLMSFKVEVISLAFIELGEPPINDIDTGNPIHSAASQVYETILANELNSSQTQPGPPDRERGN